MGAGALFMTYSSYMEIVQREFDNSAVTLSSVIRPQELQSTVAHALTRAAFTLCERS